MTRNQKTDQPQSKSLTVWAAILGGVVVVNLIFVLLTKSQAQTIQLLRTQLQTLEQDELIIRSAQEISKTYSNEITTISNVFPNEETIPEFIRTFEDAVRKSATEYTFKFNSVTPLKEQDKLLLPLTVVLKTDLEHLIVFLDELEKLPYLTHVNAIAAKTPENIQAIQEITVSIKLYVQNPFTTK